MAILNRITVGFKQILEVDADPTLTATPAPIGSEAFFDDAGVGKSYLKFGASDTQWASYQTGAEPSDWKFTTDANQLNVATAKAYFGTKTGSDFDIEFQRNGQAVFEMRTTGIVMNKQYIIRETGTLSLVAQAGPVNINGSQGISLIADTSLSSIMSDVQNSFREAGISRVAEKYVAQGVSPADGASSQQVSFASYVASKNRLAKFYISLTSTDGATAIYEKTVHMDHNNNLVLIQDDFSSKNALASSVAVAITYSAGTYFVDLTGLAGLVGKQVRIKIEEKVMF